MKNFAVALGFALFSACSADLPETKGNLLLSNEQQPIDPALGKALLTEPSLQGVAGSSSFKVPTFQLKLADADYAEIVRCARSYQLVGPSGKKVQELDTKSATRQENMRYALAEAKANQNSCRILGTFVVRDPFQDFTASDGEYYYIVNPCVQQDRSTVINVNCSYNLAVTNPIKVADSAVSKEFVQAATELATAEAKLSATVQRLYRRTERMMLIKDGCESRYFTDAANVQILKSVVNVTSVAVQAVVNVTLTGQGGALLSKFIGDARNAFVSTPGPQYKCPKYDYERDAGRIEFSTLEPQLTEIIEIQGKMSKANAEFRKLDAEILKDVRAR